MLFKNIQINDLINALDETNIIFDGNIKIVNLKEQNNGFTGVFKVKESKNVGAAVSCSSDRHTGSACWHVHGVLFQFLLDINPNAIITTNYHGYRRIDKNGGNWKDNIIGNAFNQSYESDLCSCTNIEPLNDMIESIKDNKYTFINKK